MKHNNRKLLSATIAALITAGVAAPGHAQLEEIVVTAQKITQSVNDVGITVNAFTGDTIKDMGVASAEDIAAFTPGLTVSSPGATGVPVYTIRGVGFQDITTTSSSTVGLYFDEVAIPYTVMSRGALFDVERVEVLKGPQGDLYGRNTTAGQINYISKKPTHEFEAGFTASYGRFDVLDFEGFVSGGLTESAQARVAIKSTQSNRGWQQSVSRPGDELGEKDTLGIRTLLSLDLAENASVLLKLHYVDDQSDNQAQTPYDGRQVGLAETGAPYRPLNDYVLPGGANFGQTPPWYSLGDNRAADWTNSWTNPVTGETHSLRPGRDNQLKGFSAKLEWNLGDITLTSISAYDDFERLETNDVDGGAFSVQENINGTDLEVFSQELRLSSQTDRLLWIAGVYFSKDEADEFYNFFMADSIFGDGSAAWGLPTPFAAFPIRRLHTKYQQETESRAVFGHLEYNITEPLRLTLGLRYTEEERDWSGCTFDAGDMGLSGFWNGAIGATLGAGACGTLDDTAGAPTNIANVIGTADVNDAFHPFKTDISTEKWMGKIGLDYAVTEDFLIYGTLATGFKSGGFNGNNSNTTTQLEPYDPEELTSLELGVKATLLDRTLQLNAAVFHYDYKDKQESERAITFVGAIGGLGNVDESEIQGAELDIQWAPVEGLSVNLGAAYLNTEIKKWITPVSGDFDFATGTAVNVVTVDASGSGLPQAPEWSYNAMARYEWPVGEQLVLEVSADINFTDETPDPVREQNSLDDYTLVNARVGISDTEGQWRLLLWSRNLTDEYYYTGAFGGTNGGYVRSVGLPRTYGVSLEYDF
ncbi:TonB-dependent receptor [Pseudomaricurvus alkylphenolicus]|uniref:TonB-dependent receptor n=1 Tax=Pseudomaricurvus alkylphenolicus TaxID=1306991 RepID=UPI001423F6FD|nr:TonB-dependent receptor [Pseudomaricurvus alkylphenolicus]NIB40548.1 TonB-dependent receptor [Pseudomaricurvus alkylphenolicus]